MKAIKGTTMQINNIDETENPESFNHYETHRQQNGQIHTLVYWNTIQQ